MSEFVLTDANIWLQQHNLSADANAVTLERSREAKDTTRFGSGGSRTRLPGLRAARSTVEGLWNSDPGRIEEASWNRFDDAPLVYSVAKTAAEGEIGYSMLAHEGDVSFGDEVGELFPMSIAVESMAKMVRGRVLLFGQKTATGTGTAFDLGKVVSASERLYAALHVFEYVGSGSLTMRVQGDDSIGFGSPTTRLTCSASTAAEAQWVSVAGAIAEQYFRADWTFTGTSFRAALLVGIA
jgi:hypothetical protein